MPLRQQTAAQSVTDSIYYGILGKDDLISMKGPGRLSKKTLAPMIGEHGAGKLSAPLR